VATGAAVTCGSGSGTAARASAAHRNHRQHTQAEQDRPHVSDHAGDCIARFGATEIGAAIR
jgi:hypothetical protein